MKRYELKGIHKNKPLLIDVSDYDEIYYNPLELSNADATIKEPITTDRMIEKMIDHNWIFNNVSEQEDCMMLLREVNYYTFSYYGKNYFKKDYLQIKEIYYFDLFLRNWVHDITSIIEVFLRTITVDALCLKYEPSTGFRKAQFFLDDRLYYTDTGKHKKTPEREKKVSRLLFDFADAIDRDQSQAHVKHDLEKYGGVTAWVLFDRLTFGQLSQFLSYLTKPYKDIVSDELNKYNIAEKIPSKLIPSWANSLRYLRNLASHTSKIYGETMNTLPLQHDADDVYINSLDKNMQNKLIIELLVCRRIIACMSKEKHLLWNEKIDILDKKIKDCPSVSIEKLGFSADWKTYLLIPLETADIEEASSRKFFWFRRSF